MKIKCHRIISAITGKDLGRRTAFLEVGKEYIVLFLRIDLIHSRISAGIITDDNCSVACPTLEGFEVTSQRAPESWVTAIDGHGVIDILPKSWNYPSFYDDFEDRHDPKATKLFCEEAKKIYAEEGIEVEESFFTP